MSGGGKSTLVNLLPRFYDPQKGSVCINSRDIRDYSLQSLRQSIAMVDQHTFLFNESVMDNIRYGRLDATDAEVVEVAKAAYAHDFIMRLDNGYQTVVGEQGFRLSGGERARLSIARALLKDSPILILDEATAALDSEAEHVVQAAIERLMQGRTVLVIAHRLATIQKANYIAVLQNGRIVEFGNHQELFELDAAYAKLYRMQFENAAGENVVNH
jgi:subfamily B ATP-binding cassette protein MsbA